jgi:hydroxyethylthiazole kinase-like uncharacterized protein yjeF
MPLAGLAAAEYARELLGEYGRNVLVLAGPGNNGGDAFEVAALLKHWFYRVELVFAGDEHQLSKDALGALRKWRECGGNTYAAPPAALRPDLVIDGLFGIGLARPLEGGYAELIAGINRLPCPKLALDIPSGINADTGAAMGTALRATHTISFIALKPGLLTLDGPDHCGDIRVADLGLDVRAMLENKGATTGPELLQCVLPRPHNFHKGKAGSVGVLGGAHGMLGAAVLAGRAALKLGAGKVFLGLLADHPPAVDYLQPELMLRTPRELLEAGMVTVFAAGPGMGTGKSAEQLLREVLDASVPLVLDADALNVVAASKTLQTRLPKRSAPCVLTPHPAEAARLLGCATAAVQADRVKAAIELAQRYRAIAVLKGNGSVIADPDGTWLINTSGNPGMASAGMGDVLTGMIASLLAQGAGARAATAAAVWLHGAAADALARNGAGPIGISAGELIAPARALLNAAIR